MLIIYLYCKGFFFSFMFISWRLITLQYCRGFCHTLTWISHGDECILKFTFLKVSSPGPSLTGNRARSICPPAFLAAHEESEPWSLPGPWSALPSPSPPPHPTTQRHTAEEKKLNFYITSCSFCLYNLTLLLAKSGSHSLRKWGLTILRNWSLSHSPLSCSLQSHRPCKPA